MLRAFVAGLALTLVACACQPSPSQPQPQPQPTEPQPKEPTMPSSSSLSPDAVIRSAADRDAKSGTMVEVFGTYEEVASGKAPDAPPDGHAAVRLDDGSLVHLQPPWHPDAVRPADELARYRGKPVVVKGMLFAECPPPPDGRAYAKVPCMAMDIVVMDRKAYDALQSGVLE